MKTIKTQLNSKNCIICGMENPLGLKATFYNLEDDSVAAIFTFRSEHQSYPDRTHGGMIAALLDELMGRALWVKEPQTFGVTTSLNITYRRPVPANEKLKARAEIVFNSPRGFTAQGKLFDWQGKLLAEGNCKYLKLPFDKVFSKEASFHQEMCYEMPLDLLEIDFPE